MAMAALSDISAVFKSPSKSSNRAGGGGGGKSLRGPSQQNVDRERLTVDISALRKQYSKLRQRQKQAQIILSCKSGTALQFFTTVKFINLV